MERLNNRNIDKIPVVILWEMHLQKLTLELRFSTPLTWPFVAADVSMPIIGYDIHYHHELIIDAS